MTVKELQSIRQRLEYNNSTFELLKKHHDFSESVLKLINSDIENNELTIRGINLEIEINRSCSVVSNVKTVKQTIEETLLKLNTGEITTTMKYYYFPVFCLEQGYLIVKLERGEKGIWYESNVS